MIVREPNDGVNAPRFGSCEIRGLENWGPFPSAAVIVEAAQKLSSGGEDRLTRMIEMSLDGTQSKIGLLEYHVLYVV